MIDRLKTFFPAIIGFLTSVVVATASIGGLYGSAAQESVPASARQVAKTAPRQAATVTRHEGQVKANGITIAYESFGPD